MRHRRWVVFVILFLILLPPLAVVTVRVASERPGFREALLARIMPEVTADLSVGDLSLGLASLTMSDIVVDLGERGVVRVPRASVDVSLQKLVMNGLDVRRAVSSILIDAPTAEVVLGPGRADSSERAAAPDDVRELLPDYLAVSDGTLVLTGADGGSWRVRGIDALLERRESGDVTGGFSGSVPGGEDNLTGTVEAGSGAVSATLAVDGASLSPDLPLPGGAGLSFRSGRVSATASARFDTGGGSVRASGNLDEGRVELTAVDADLEDVDAVVRFEDGALSIESLTGRWDGAPLSARGTIDLQRDRFEGLTVSVEGVRIERALKAANAETVDAAGVLTADLTLNGPLRSPVLGLDIENADGRAGTVAFSDLAGRVVLSDEVADIERLEALLFGGTVSLTGRTELDLGSLVVEGRATGLDASLLGESLGQPDAGGRIDLTRVSVSSADGRIEGEGIVRWHDVRLGPLRAGSGAGGAVLTEDLLAVTLESPEWGWRTSAEVDLRPGEPVLDVSASLDSVSVDSLVRLPSYVGDLVVDGGTRLRGPADSLEVLGTLRVRTSGFEGAFDLSGRADLAVPSRSFTLAFDAASARVRGLESPLSGTLDRLGSGALEASVSLERLGRLEGRVGPGPERSLSAGIVVSETELCDVYALVADGEPPADLGGFVFVSASASGTVDEPVMSGQLEIADMRVGPVDDLSASAGLSLGRDTLRIESFLVREQERAFLRGAGTAALGGPLSLTVAGDGVPGQLLGGGEATRFDVTVGIGGTTGDPTLDGRVESRDGSFLGVPFDDFVARATGARGAVRVDPLSLERDGVYRVSAVGRFPVGGANARGGETEATLDISVDGDPIALLVEGSGFGESGPGSGSLRVSLAGEPGNLIVADGRLEATAPWVRPEAIVENLGDVSADIEIADGAVVRGVVAARADGAGIRIESTRRRTVDGRLLPPLDVAGVDAGILSLTTDGGVSVSIPGLMSEGEFGRMTLAGPAGGDAFLITGPGEEARLLGEIEFSDLSFVYPFEDGDGGDEGGPNPVLDAEWALEMRAGRNVWYRRSDADVKIEEGGTLEFRGSPSGGTLCVRGRLESTRGTVTYLNRDFDVRTAFVDFPFFCEAPRFFVEAETRVEDGTTVTLTMDSYEPALSFAGPGATLDESAITLSSDAPEDDSEEEILSRLQYGMGFALLEGEEQAALERRQALDVVGGQLSMRVVRPILAPVETRIRRRLGLDLVRIDVDFVEHFLSQLDLWRAQEGSAQYLPFLVTSRITLGKYLAGDWLMSYIGTTRAYQEDIAEQSLGLRHELGIEYEVSRNTSLSMRVVYDPVIQGWDRRLSIENRYEF
jgi:hypothetical protein